MSTKGNTMSLTYRIGDATCPRERPAVILHVVNNKGLWGAGFSGGLDYAYLGRPGTLYRSWAQGNLGASAEPFGLDGVLFQKLDDQLWLCHLCAQNGVGRGQQRIDYNSLEFCLKQAAARAPEVENLSFHLPRIGTGYGGGRWEAIEDILHRTLTPHFPAYVYDLG